MHVDKFIINHLITCFRVSNSSYYGDNISLGKK